MAESNLSLAYADLQSELGHFIGWGRTSGNWTAGQLALIDVCRDSGTRHFYFEAIDSNELQLAMRLGRPPVAHEWSFLKPLLEFDAWPTFELSFAPPITFATGKSTISNITNSGGIDVQDSMIGKTLTFLNSGNTYTITDIVTPGALATIKVSGDASAESVVVGISPDLSIESNGNYNLPDDFGALNGPITTSPPPYTTEAPIEVVNEVNISHARQEQLGTARPRVAAVFPRPIDPTVGQRFTLMLSPIPDQLYTVKFKYLPLLDKLTSTNKYAAGGAAYYEALLECCLAAAERKLNDGAGGLHTAEAQRKLDLAIMYDRQRHSQEFFGRMDDPRSVEVIPPAKRFRLSIHGYPPD